MKKTFVFLLVFQIFLSCGESDSDSDYMALTAEEGEQLSGGINGTVTNGSEEAFGFKIQNLTNDEDVDFGVGNSFFRQTWVSAPSTTATRDGLGPFFNATACSSCHFKDGRGKPPVSATDLGKGLLLRLSINGHDAYGNPFTDPVYGGQLQDNSILGVASKGAYSISYQTITETLADGTVVQLQKPSYLIQNLNYGALSPGLLISPRVANQIIGLGLLDAMNDNDLLAFADEYDVNNDGISGRANSVYDFESGTQRLGKFGWKANEPSIKQQVAAAFSGDIGITSSIFPNENCPPGIDCGSIPNGGSPEISDRSLNRVALYAATLSVPARRNYTDANVLKGKQIFQQINCTGCHIPKMQTGSNYAIAALRNQVIRPYTDLLLHDMGEGLADNAPSFLATGTEWRTQPLWGIGLINVVNKHTNLLHDGRARNVQEAILWHGGEAQNAKEKYKQLSAQERNDLLAFINSL